MTDRPPGRPPRALVVGVGTEHRSDDRCGLEVARRLRTRLGDRAIVVESSGEPASLLDVWDRATHVVVIDAVRTGAPPGTVVRYEVGAGGLAVPAGVASTHGLSVAEAVALGRALGRLPAHLLLVGIEAGALGMSETMSEPVARALAPAVALVEAELARWETGPPGGPER